MLSRLEHGLAPGAQRCVLVQGAYQIDNILKHGVNNFFILLDVFLSKQPFVSYHFQARQT